jgi:pyruvate formate lyase activating enzyme
MIMKEALFWEHADDGAAACGLCAHLCHISPGKRGICSVRTNNGGTLYTNAYGRSVAEHVDPVEKKPLYHFLPSSQTFSLAAAGCNFKCDFCQNWSISQAFGLRGIGDRGSALTPQEIVERAIKHKCQSVSYTYTEPTVFFEYAYEAAKIAKDAGLKNIFVSNGYMSPEALRMSGPYLDACNIDLKSFRDNFYKTHCGARLSPVLDSMKLIRDMGIWLEVTTLVITGENDSNEELGDIAAFIADELGSDVPWHVSRFFPMYQMAHHPMTDLSSIERAIAAGREAGLQFVYAGNVDFAQDTLCPKCRETLIRRRGYAAKQCGVKGGRCEKCNTVISGVF